MKRLINATKEFIQEASTRLGLQPKELLALHEQLSTRDKPDELFCSCCLHLESNPEPDNALRVGLKSKKDLVISASRASDHRYGLLFYMIHHFYFNDPRVFLDSEPTAAPPNVSALQWDALFGKDVPDADTLQCSVCKGPVKHTPSGWLCDVCGGGTEEVKELPQISDTRQVVESYLKDEDHEALFGSKAEKKVIQYNTEPDVPWNNDQQEAFRKIFAWLRQPEGKRAPIFRLYGYAGTGKTTMARKIACFVENELHGYVVFAAYTGKAASVLKSKGCANTSTIHGLIYRPKVDPITGKFMGENINRESILAQAKLCVIDEASMVTPKQAMDLMSFGVPIIVLGDPGQLPPPKEAGYFNTQEPDHMLQEIERQAADSPIIWLATKARKGKVIKPGRYGDVLVLGPNAEVADEHVLKGAILVGSNRTRRTMNERYRRLKGYYHKDTQFPSKGETLICLKNNHESGMYNGTLWTCTQPKIQPMLKPKDYRDLRKGMIQTNLDGLHFKVRSQDMFDAAGAPLIRQTVCSAHMFDTNLPEPPWQDVAHCDQFDFGYALTVHKAQGSQFDDGLIIDESWLFEKDANKHRYTAFTRFVSGMTVKLTEGQR